MTDYEHAYEVVDEIMEGKTAYDQLPHTPVLFEDAMNIFTEKKYANLYKIVFKNRHRWFTIFINVQEKKDIIWENYKKISSKQVLLFTYDKNGTPVEIILK
jgi:hypothetical protein